MAPRRLKRSSVVVIEPDGRAASANRNQRRRTVGSVAHGVADRVVEPNGSALPATPRTKYGARIVTPSHHGVGEELMDGNQSRSARRALLKSPTTVASVEETDDDNVVNKTQDPKVKKRLAFGRVIHETPCPKNVASVYGIIRKLTGSVGGNGSFGAIYGELTMGSMQKMIELMKVHTEFNSTSKFIDVGSGIGKPNLHVCQDPGVAFSYGIEMEMSRWMLGMTNLKAILKEAKEQQTSNNVVAEERIGHNCYFGFGNIMDAESFDPFTHVYMFSIGFPPKLFERLATMFNESSSQYLICYHAPSAIIDSFEFDVELVVQAPTSMHGSKEGHMGYIYKRCGATPSRQQECSPFFKDAWDAVNGGLESLTEAVESQMQDDHFHGRMTRSRGVKMTAVSKQEQEEEEEAERKARAS